MKYNLFTKYQMASSHLKCTKTVLLLEIDYISIFCCNIVFYNGCMNPYVKKRMSSCITQSDPV